MIVDKQGLGRGLFDLMLSVPSAQPAMATRQSASPQTLSRSKLRLASSAPSAAAPRSRRGRTQRRRQCWEPKFSLLGTSRQASSRGCADTMETAVFTCGTSWWASSRGLPTRCEAEFSLLGILRHSSSRRCVDTVGVGISCNPLHIFFFWT